MKALKLLAALLILILISSCREKVKPGPVFPLKRTQDIEVNIPVDKGFTEYIESYTSGIVSVNSVIEIRFTPDFAVKANREISPGLFMFEPAVRGKAEWTDNLTLVFRPAKTLDPGITYTGKLNLDKIAEVKADLRVFPIRISTIKKDFVVTTGILESSPEGNTYSLHGEITASDYISSSEVESYLRANAGRKKQQIVWDHSDILVHKFIVTGIGRTDKPQKLELEWDGTQAGVRQKGSAKVNIPPSTEFSVIDIILNKEGSNGIDIIFSDPLDPTQETKGLIWLSPEKETTISINSNIVSLFPATRSEGIQILNIEQSVRNFKGNTLTSSFNRNIDFTPPPPSVELLGNGVIIPVSSNLVFPFKAVNLKAVDLKIIKIFENNLPWFLQENEINTGYTIKRFGRPVYSGRVDLIIPSGGNAGNWNLYTVDLAEYINVEPGILYRVELSMRPSYSLYPCTGGEDFDKYEEMLRMSEEINREFWDDPENYYSDSDDYVYYSFGFNWRERDNPCKASYFNPDRKVTRNILASNFGIVAKSGENNTLHVIVNDLLTALPLSEVTIDVYDFQLQQIVSGKTGKNGSVSLSCNRKPFLLIARKDKDRNYLKLNEGASLSLSSFDVSGTKPEKGIKAFIYGERDVWRPGDSIFLSVFIKDMNKSLPAGHPVMFELINPLEQRVDNQVQIPEGKNLLVFPTSTANDAVTGNYTARVTVGGASFTKRVKIETIKPNRLKIELDFDGELLGGSDRPSNGSLNVKWLNGGIAGKLQSSVEYLLKHSKTEFKKYPQYNFDDPAISFYSETVKMFDGQVDENGNASVIFNPGRDINAPGMLNAVFTARVSEKGGDESIIQTSRKYAPYKVFTGINLPGLKGKDRILFTDTDNEVKIVTVDQQGNPVNSTVDISVYKISYRWWWESDDENLASYISNNMYKPVITKQIITSGGEAAFSFNINRNEWGRYLIRATSSGGHSTGKIILIDWPWEYGMKGGTEGATLLSINTDKEKYNPGDEVKLSFPAPENSQAIITLENATSVLEEIHTRTTKGNTIVSFKARAEMAPNVYAYVTVVQPHAQTLNDMPIRLYGAVPVMVEDPETRLAPIISAPDEVRSGRSFEVKVSEAGKKTMTYTLAVVDEGLLDITGFKVPDPWNYFYAREALGIRTWDLYDMVLGAFGGTLDRIFAVGGDETLIDRSANKGKRFVPVVKFLGPFTLAPGKTATHSISLPMYTGSVKTMVIAGSERAYGSAEKSILVKDPVMVLVTAPRVVSPGEKAELPVTLFVNKDGIRNVQITASADDLIFFETKTKTISVSGPGETDTGFTFSTGESTGVSKIRITAEGGGENAVYELDINVRSPNPPETRADLKILKPGEQWQSSFTPFGIGGSDAAYIEASTLPSINLDKQIGYLLDYPHGCTEQITSAAFPLIWLKNLTGENALASKTTAEKLKDAVSKIATRQMSNGGIALWPGNYQPDNWITSYAGHFMTEAERAGYSIPSGFKQKWLSFQKKLSREWQYDQNFKQSANDQAYRLFTLSLAGEPERGAMNRLRESTGIPQVSKWLLAAAFAVSGRPEVAGDLLDMRNTGTEEEFSGYYYGSRLRDKAIIIYTLSVLKREEEALPLLRSVCSELNQGTWYSTQSLAWGLISYMKFAETTSESNTGQATLNITFNNEKSSQTLQSNRIFLKDLKVKSGINTIVAENTSDKTLYINLVRKGIPLKSDETGIDNGLQMKADYMNMEMRPLDQTSLEQGSDFMMVVRITNNMFTHVDNIALTQMIPSGWEIRNTRLFEARTGIKESSFEYRDFRDDRVNTYFNLNQGETKTFVLILNAAYKGEFYQPPIWCEAMYTENCYSRIPGTRVKVTGTVIE